MNQNDCIIRLELPADYEASEELVRECFWNVYRPGCLEHYVLHCLRSDPDFIPELNFVLVSGDRIIGRNVFVQTHINCDDGSSKPVLTMGPICILPEFQRKGLGKMLLDVSLEKAASMGFGAVCFEGNINFYRHSGFTYASQFGIRYHGLPEDADSSFFLCKELIPHFLRDVTGEYSTPKGYFVDETETEAFDKKFPPKEKLILPGQLM